jgi:lysophospholipase L1-like esterase
MLRSLATLLLLAIFATASSQQLHTTKTHSPASRGVFLLIAGNNVSDMTTMTRMLDTLGYDVAALAPYPERYDALKAIQNTLQLLKAKNKPESPRRLAVSIMALGSGAQLAAMAVQRLGKEEQPDNLLLISPSGLDETLPGTVLPAVMPPLHPTARLLTIITDTANKVQTKASGEYTKTWIGYDGIAKLGSPANLPAAIEAFLQSPLAISDTSSNPAAIPVAGYSPKRHEEKLALVAREKFDLIMLGNSITNNFEKPAYQPVWQQFFAPRNALNLGFSGYRTENILWNILNGELEGQSPKVLVLEIGTNNVDEKNYLTRHTAGQLAGGMEAIVKVLRQKLPATKIILLRCFPGCYGGPNPTSHRAILQRASDLVSGLADNKNIFYCDINHVFLNLDGSINHDMMPDWLHPSPAGAKAWAGAMEPLLSQLMGDSSRDTAVADNTAIIPISKLENDSYDWWARHGEVLRIKDSVDPEIVLVGNSITHFWGGLPQLRSADGRLRQPNGPRSWAGLFNPYRVLNLGFGWDRTQNVLWRLDHGELDGLHPRLVIINIGTNNTSQTEHARMNTAPEIVEGIRAVCQRVRSKAPGARIILMGIFAREEKPSHPRRILINATNKLLEAWAKEENITFLNLSDKFLAPDGTMLPGLTSDFTHPTDKGYQIWADALRPFVDQQYP